jgi:hypothetical protein
LFVFNFSCCCCLFFSFFFLYWGLNPRILCMLDKHLPFELWPQGLNLYFFFFLIWSGWFLGRHSITWVILPTLFSVGYFPDKVSRTIYELASNHNPPNLCLFNS